MSLITDHLSSFPLMESLVISIEWKAKVLEIVLDNPTRVWQAYYKRDVLPDEMRFRWFRRFRFYDVVEIEAWDRDHPISLDLLSSTIHSGSNCVTAATLTNEKGVLQLGKYVVRWFGAKGATVDERKLRVEFLDEEWHYFDVDSNELINFERPFEIKEVRPL